MNLIGVLASSFFLRNFGLDDFVLIIRLDHIQIVVAGDNAVEVIGVRGVKDFSGRKVDFVATVRNIVDKRNRDDIAYTVAVHRTAFEDIYAVSWNTSGHQIRNEPAAAGKAE